MSRTVSARISNEMHEQLREWCNNAGCSMSDWIEAAIDYIFTHSSDFDFGDPDDEDETEEVSEKKEVSKGIVVSVE